MWPSSCLAGLLAGLGFKKKKKLILRLYIYIYIYKIVIDTIMNKFLFMQVEIANNLLLFGEITIILFI